MPKLLINFASVLSLLVSFTPLQAQETTLTIGTPKMATLSSEGVSTAQVDSVLRNVAPSTFGQNFTRDKANKVFTDFANLRAGLATSLAQTIAGQTNIRQVYSVIVTANALNFRLSQKTNSVSGELGSISTRVSLLADVDGLKSIFCPSVNVTFDVKNIRAFGDYNYISGDVSGARVTYDLVIISASCNGLLGGLFNPTSPARSQINSAIQDQINTQIAFVNMQRLFSLADFAKGLDRFRSETIVSAIIDRAISIFQEMVNNAAINTPGIVLDFNVKPSAFAGDVNAISVYASHAQVDITASSRPDTGGPIQLTLSVPTNTERVDLYSRNSRITGSSFNYIGSTTSTIFTKSTLSPFAEVVAIGRNATLSGLESFPGAPSAAIESPGSVFDKR
jgi:hypothetical protein